MAKQFALALVENLPEADRTALFHQLVANLGCEVANEVLSGQKVRRKLQRRDPFVRVRSGGLPTLGKGRR